MQPHQQQPGEPRLTDEQFIAFVLGEADAGTAAMIEATAQTDAAIAARLGQMRIMQQSLRHLQSMDAAFAVSSQQRAALVAIMPVQQADWFTQLTDRATEVAMLLLNSLRGPAIAGYRSLDTGSARLLRYECLDGVIDMRIESDVVSRELNVTGQFVGQTQLASLRFLQRGNGAEIARVSLAPDGYFECVIPPGVYAIELIASDTTSAVVPRVELGDTESPSP